MQEVPLNYAQLNDLKPWMVTIYDVEVGSRVGDYVYELPPCDPAYGPNDHSAAYQEGVWRYRPIRESEPDKAFEKKPESRMEEIVRQAFSDSEDEKTTYRAIRVLIIEGTKEFVRETMKRSKIDSEMPTVFLEQGGTVSYRSTKLEKVLDVEDAELWSE